MTAPRSDDDRRLAKIVAYVVTAAWAASFIIGIINPSYQPPASVHPLMLLVAGGAFGEGIIRSAVKSNSNRKDDES